MSTPKKLVLATANPGKVNEFNQLFAQLGIDVVTQTSLGVESVEETGGTFIENAILKARHAALHTGLPAIADDSGLVVPALQGAPGIYSSRYAGPSANDEANVQKLLQELDGMHDRRAHFFCVLVFMRHSNDPTPLISQGYWHGTITTSPTGFGGFGYDPVFYVTAERCTAAQMDKSRKAQLSHRGQAMSVLFEQMRQSFA